MKTLLALLMVVILAGCGSEDLTTDFGSASDSDVAARTETRNDADEFRGYMRNLGHGSVISGVSDTDIDEVAESVCDLIRDMGAELAAGIIVESRHAAGYSEDEVAAIAAASILVYCPEFQGDFG